MRLIDHPRRGHGRRHAAFVLLVFSSAALLMQSCGGDKGTTPNNYPKPVITDVPEVSQITDAQALVQWTTDVEATTTVMYGFQSGQYLFKDSSATAIKEHSVRLANLRSKTTYYFVAQSKSPGGFVRSDEGSFQTILGARDLAPAAWEQYKQGKIREAVQLFVTLLAIEPQSYEAFTGLGWCYADAGIDSLEKANSYFTGAISLRNTHADALAGRGFVQLVLNYYSQAAADFARVISLNPAYAFAYNNKVTARSVRLGLAEAHFYLQAFSSAQSQIDLLAPGNGLAPGLPASWLVDGKTFATYPEALLAWIEKLKSQL